MVDACGLPFATMFMDKCVLDEGHPRYIGMYDGKLMNEQVRAFVEGCDCVLGIGAMLTDFNSGAFTAQLDQSKSINIMHHSVRVGRAMYNNVEMKDVLVALAKELQRKEVRAAKAPGLAEPDGKPNERITVQYLYPRWQQMLSPGDILVTETGTSSLGLSFAKMPKGSTFLNQALWGAIGWATPAAFGAALAAPDRRTILVTGEGSHQLTAQEVSQFHRFGLRPIIFVLNNDGYLIERLLCKNPKFNQGKELDGASNVENPRDGVRSGVNGTPSFFVNGRHHQGASISPTLSRRSSRISPPPRARSGSTRSRAQRRQNRTPEAERTPLQPSQ